MAYQSGSITPNTLIIREGGTDWQAYGNIVAVQDRTLAPTPPNRPETLVAAYQTRKCPFCAELISAEAKKCKHCGETLDAALRAAEEAKRSQSNQAVVFMNAGGGGVAASPEKHPFPHGKHLIMTILTGGGWALIWILHYLFRNRNYYR